MASYAVEWLMTSRADVQADCAELMTAVVALYFSEKERDCVKK
jgi:hypothetical protein